MIGSILGWTSSIFSISQPANLTQTNTGSQGLNFRLTLTDRNGVVDLLALIAKMTVKLILYVVTVFLFVNVMCIDPYAHVSFARVFPNKATKNRLRRAVVTLSPSAYTEDEKKEMLDAHNEFRRTSDPPAADMNLLTWNDQLADSAQSWAEQCIWDHGQVEFENQQYDPMGQNLWRGGNKVSVSAVNAWHNEYKYYNYTENKCQEDKACGHYTQVLWGDTKEVGCGFYSCPDGGTIVACNYGPAGNYNRHPYTEGPRCSLCANPGYCYDGTLCSTQCHDQSIVTGTCQCSFQCQNCGVLNETDCTCSCKDGWHGDQCEAVCEDTSKYCNAGWYRAQCSGYSYVRDGCPAMCSICVEPTDATADQCPCGGKMCKNGGQLNTATCTCSCPNEYTGDLCDTMVVLTEATESPVPVTTDPTICGGKTCQNNSVLTVATCTCECLDGFTGLYCENVVTTPAPTIKTEIKTTIEVTTIITGPITTQMEVRTDKETRATTDKARATTNRPITTDKPTTTDKMTTYKTETNTNTPIPPVCQLRCPKDFVLDNKVCECIENIYEEPPVGSANTLKCYQVYLLTLVTLLCHLLGTCYHQ